MTGAPDELIDEEEAAHLLEVAPARVEDMVAEGMLTPIDGDGTGAWRFRRSDVLAVRELGG